VTNLRRTLRVALGGAPLIALAACFLPGFEKVDATGTGGAGGAGGG